MINDKTPRRGRPKSTRKRSQILQASADLFLSNGYDKTSMDAVASAAGVSKQTLYSHFENKEQLFRSCITGKTEDHGLNLSWADPHAPIEETLTRFGVQLMGLFDDQDVMPMYRLLMTHGEHHPQLCQVFYESGPLATKQMLSKYLAGQAQLGKIELDDPFESAELLISMIERNFLTKLLLGVGDGMNKDAVERYAAKRVIWFLRSHSPTTRT